MKYTQLPDRIQETLAKVYFHAEQVKEGEIVYKEKDVIDFYCQEIRREWTPIGEVKPRNGESIFIFCIVTLANNIVREAMYSRDDNQFKTDQGISLTKKVLAWRLMPKPYKKPK